MPAMHSGYMSCRRPLPSNPKACSQQFGPSHSRSRLAEHRLRLEAGQLIEIRGGRGLEVACHEGAVWITQSNDPLDIVLIADESFVLQSSGLAVVSACGGPAAFAVKVEQS